ncbi:ABC transporter permease [Clostridium botulinum]|uniref:FtsX-like permease family protein n=1 Tax=Clostridium botulinum TaxID=1491 RepID=UPI0013F10795|nr:FtsX-like permease family protein [Clostridium botulinum]MBN1041267.1 hypothetical protein [Clostridium botulinum]NFH90429.1 ABC transporter permease [Clostridium botulinum]NFI17469.1 ABC transporter permease [Clostridium botulinum]NFI53182.1 ABC transporter permease [Clostridium botulinum]NFL92999.1 ABC transporter permease [Clostridium botulinum]
MSKYTKIDIFLIIGFLVSAFAFSLAISTIYSKYNKVMETNEFNKNYKYLDVSTLKETRDKDGFVIVYKKEDEKNINLLDIINEVQEAGYKEIILSPFETQIEVENDSYINDIWPCSSRVDIKSDNIINGRYLTEKELSGDEKVAVIGFGLEKLIEEKNGQNYIKVFDEYYKVIGIIGDTEVFKYSSIIPIRSLYFINNPIPKVTFWENSINNTNIKEVNNKNITLSTNNIPKIPVLKYLFKNVYELKNSLYQVLLGITNLLLFSYFFSKNITKRVAIMKILGAKNIHVFKEIFIKFLKISSVGIIGGVILSKLTVDFMRQSFTGQYSIVNIQNILSTSILIFSISIIVSICVLFNVIRFKIMKEIR